MPRFFIGAEALDGNIASVTGEDARHIARALRMAEGEEITVLTPDATEHRCRLSRIRDDLVTAEVLSSKPGESESPVSVRLYMAYPKGDKLETVVQKAVELGVRSVTPFLSERCIRRPREDRRDTETARLTRIAAEAAKQSGRSRLPQISPLISFREMLREAAQAELALFCYEGNGTAPLPLLLDAAGGDVKEIAVIVGSEGGFSPSEAEEARNAGLRMCNLGPRILRCETAPLFVLSCLAYRYELPDCRMNK